MRKLISILLILAVLVAAALAVLWFCRKPAPAPAPAAAPSPAPVTKPAPVVQNVSGPAHEPLPMKAPPTMKAPIATEEIKDISELPDTPSFMRDGQMTEAELRPYKLSNPEPKGAARPLPLSVEEVERIEKDHIDRDNAINARRYHMTVEEWTKLSEDEQTALKRQRKIKHEKAK